MEKLNVIPPLLRQKIETYLHKFQRYNEVHDRLGNYCEVDQCLECNSRHCMIKFISNPSFTRLDQAKLDGIEISLNNYIQIGQPKCSWWCEWCKWDNLDTYFLSIDHDLKFVMRRLE